MKILLSMIFSLFFSISSFAECSSFGISVFPKKKEINQNSIFMIEGYAISQKIIKNFNKKNKAYLINGNSKIRLVVQELNVGRFNLTQAILKPESELEENIEYTLIIENLSQDEKLQRFNPTTNKYEPITFKVSGKDTVKPVIKEYPKEVKKTLVHYGCGPAEYVIFDYSIDEKSEIIVKTIFKKLKTNELTNYYIIPRENKLYVGHGMCSGGFSYDESLDYEVEFQFMDSSGNNSVTSNSKIKFTKPTKETFDDED